MESLFVGSLAKPSILPSFPAKVDLFSPSSGAQVLRFKERNNLDKQFGVPSISQKKFLLCQHVGARYTRLVALSRKGSDKCLVNAASGQPLESEPSKDPLNTLQGSLDAFYRFSRPHTVIGTVLSIISVSLLAVEKLSDFSPLFLTGMSEAIVAAFFMNIYIVGLNQLSDIDIDKVNKPYLPLASGEYSIKTAVTIIASFAIMSFWLGWIVGSGPLFCALFVSFVLGTAYSINVPLLRWKRFAFVAALCILAVRAVIVQLAFYLHIQSFVFGRPALFSKPVIFATAFMSFFSVVIALFKDIPDIVGDKIYGIRSFTVRLGQEKVFWICIALLQIAYLVAILVGMTASQNWSKVITIAGHILLASMLWSQAKSVDLGSKAAITSFYMFIWKLFYAEYFLIPFVR
ncbi:OLC1v1035111C3 [Oldenlandia corymbosa var. corymbosa]|uniref:OLC1v1035111C3 n=1 Tax=Oldenlandia corymbosa var. corymbosa TaxID=529605 RepID=A0AAV1CTZ3_OLDCO|nr:OLC1v1035111C3 [Oldenlandia corymbosa var. corymbosa]